MSKCSAPRASTDLECSRCGVIFAKLTQRVERGPSPPPPPPIAHDVEPPAARRREAVSHAVMLGRAALLLGLVVWTWQFASAPMGVGVADSFLHLPNLTFHEAGHMILGIFGRFIGVLGGSLFQVALPLARAGVFLKQGDRFAAAICTWWGGQNLLDVAPYIADARALQLVLLGGRTGAEVEGHDWEYLLTQMNWLHLDRTLGLAAHRIGLVVMIAALVWAGLSVNRNGRG